MTQRTTTRGVAATAATALAVGALALLGTGTAGAAPVTITWDDYYSHFTRTVSNATPAADEVITITTKFERTNGTEEHLYNIKDRHPACLTYVPGSAKMNNTPLTPQVDDGSDPTRDPLVSVDFGANDWIVKNQTAFHPVLSIGYKVGADCARGAALDTGMDYNGSLGFGGYYTQGPAVTVAKTASTTTLAPVTGATIGKTVTLTANVTPANAGGTVTFKDGADTIGTSPVGADGTATALWSPATEGRRTIVADYLGTATVTASSSQASVTVAPEDGGEGGAGSLGSLFGSS